MNSLQPERSQRSSSSAISVSPASIIIWTSSRSSARSRAQRGWTKTQLLPSVERRTLRPSDDPDGRRTLGLRFDTTDLKTKTTKDTKEQKNILVYFVNFVVIYSLCLLTRR